MNINGGPINCADCGVPTIRTGPAQKLCRPCVHERKKDYKRRYEHARRVAAGCPVRGSQINCRRCGVEITKVGVRQLYCPPCSAAQMKADALASARRCWANRTPEDRERQRLYNRAYNARRYRSDPKVALRQRVISGICQSLRLRQAKGSPLRPSQMKRGRNWQHIVGWSVEDLRGHLEARFVPGMTWENRSLWHIDHIVPLSAFTFQTPDDPGFREAWALSNLQPLWALDNIRKGGRR